MTMAANIVATLAALYLLWHCRDRSREYAYATHKLHDPALARQVVIIDACACAAFAFVLGGIWL